MRLIVDVPKDIVDTLNSEEPLLSMKQEADLIVATYKALDEEICEDAISRQDMALNIVSFYNKATGKKKTLDFLCKCVEGLPSMQPKQKTGHWIDQNGDTICSECQCNALYDGMGYVNLSDYCPDCGARMR